MPGRSASNRTGKALASRVKAVAEHLGLTVRTEVEVGRRLWGPIRKIDVVITDPATRRSLGIECKFQQSKGSAEEKIPSIVEDIKAWPIPGIVVIDGPGFSDNMRQFLISTGKAVYFSELENWLQLYFGVIN
jgi:hypothetical protein